MKKNYKKLLKKLLTALSSRKNNVLIKKKVRQLIRKKKYKVFPVKDVKPIIVNYPFYRKTDLVYLNFFYSTLNKADANFLSLPIYYNVVEPVLNDIKQLRGIKDKNYLNILFPSVKTPATVLRKMNYAFYDKDFNTLELDSKTLNNLLDCLSVDLILKPSNDSGAGKSIKLFSKERGKYFDRNGLELDLSLLMSYPDFIIQEVVRQHNFFSQFNQDSNNTVRILTYRSIKNNCVSVLHRLLRVGSKGNFLDHDNLGGIAVGISDSHMLNSCGYSQFGDEFEIFNEILLKSIGRVPFIDKMEAVAYDLAKKVIYGRILAFDFTVDIDGNVLLIEINAWRNGISQYQMNNGSVFGSYTKEILDFCHNKQSDL